MSPSVRHTNIEPMPDQRETHIPSTHYQPVVTSSRPPSTGPMTSRPYPYSSTSDASLCRTVHSRIDPFSDGYISPTRDPYYRSTAAPSVTSSLSRPRIPLSRAAVDVVDSKSMLRFCRLTTEPGQTFGFELAQEDKTHVIRNVKPDSPAGRTTSRSVQCH